MIDTPDQRGTLDVRLEVLPFPSAEPQLENLASGTRITVTVSPRNGVDHTLGFAERWSARGLEVVPHLAARMITGADHLDAIATRIRAAGFAEVFVVGGDQSPPLGPYDGAAPILEQLARRVPGLRVGVAGYPEGHPAIPTDELERALEAKSSLASALVTQICFDPSVIVAWIRSIRGLGVTLPVFVGIPGVVERKKLIELSARVGVGASTRFLRKNLRSSAKLLLRSTYEPTDLIDAITAAAADPTLGIAGFHVFTFNQIATTDEWLRRRAAVARAA